MTITQARLVEHKNDLHTEIGFRVRVTSDELTLIVDELVKQRDDRAKVQDENWQLQRERADAATDIEALAQRLAKVEDGWAAANRDVGKLHARIDQACEIIGARIGGLEERIDAMADGGRDIIAAVELTLTHSEGVAERVVKLERQQGGGIAFGVQPNPPGFPTGAGTTVEDAIAQVEEPGAESEPLKPQRGDRVRLEGARTFYANILLEDGWVDVIGAHSEDPVFQVRTSSGAIPWVGFDDPGLKEVRRGAANLPK